MTDSEQHTLDVDFTLVAVNNQGDVPVRPRLPNVVSRRGHAVKIIAQVRDVPDGEFPMDVSITAHVSVLNNPCAGDEGDLSRRFEFWGRSAEPVIGTIPSRDQLPLRLEIIVPRTNEDDHLGQGPDYNATVTVAALANLLDSNDGVESAARTEEADRPEETTGIRDSESGNGTFIIPFSSR